MAVELKIFSIYKVPAADKYYLLRTERPGFSNASQDEEALAVGDEQSRRNHLLEQIGKTHNLKAPADFEFIGELQGCPIGDKLYAGSGNQELNIYYMETEFGPPWIIIGNTNSEPEFSAELNNDEDLLRLKPIGRVKQIKATFITENGFDLF
ncbi:MAG: hypothetical protein LBK75_03675 [Oscillospiraceae bacterium]|jgi:hypothetical protein|nr:hypothetical protein [Oscillospiraceae bacterium]